MRTGRQLVEVESYITLNSTWARILVKDILSSGLRAQHLTSRVNSSSVQTSGCISLQPSCRCFTMSPGDTSTYGTSPNVSTWWLAGLVVEWDWIHVSLDRCICQWHSQTYFWWKWFISQPTATQCSNFSIFHCQISCDGCLYAFIKYL